MAMARAYVTTRIDRELKSELEKASFAEGRTLSDFCRLLLEYGWSAYQRAGSIDELAAQALQILLDEEMPDA